MAVMRRQSTRPISPSSKFRRMPSPVSSTNSRSIPGNTENGQSLSTSAIETRQSQSRAVLRNSGGSRGSSPARSSSARDRYSLAGSKHDVHAAIVLAGRPGELVAFKSIVPESSQRHSSRVVADRSARPERPDWRPGNGRRPEHLVAAQRALVEAACAHNQPLTRGRFHRAGADCLEARTSRSPANRPRRGRPGRASGPASAPRPGSGSFARPEARPACAGNGTAASGSDEQGRRNNVVVVSEGQGRVSGNASGSRGRFGIRRQCLCVHGDLRTGAARRPWAARRVDRLAQRAAPLRAASRRFGRAAVRAGAGAAPPLTTMRSRFFSMVDRPMPLTDASWSALRKAPLALR